MDVRIKDVSFGAKCLQNLYIALFVKHIFVYTHTLYRCAILIFSVRVIFLSIFKKGAIKKTF